MALRKTHPPSGGSGFAAKGNPGLGDKSKPDAGHFIRKGKEPVKRAIAKGRGKRNSGRR